MSRSSPPSSRCISNTSRTSKAIARAKAEIFLGLEPGGAAILNRDNPHYALLAKLAQRSRRRARSSASASTSEAEARLETVKLKPECSCVSASILGEQVSYKLGAPGRHLVQNSLAVLGAVSLLGGDLAKAALALAAHAARRRGGASAIVSRFGGGARHADRRELQRQPGLDARGDRAPRPGRARPGSGRRIAVLGDMRELGEDGAGDARRPRRAARRGRASTRVFLAGPLMRALWDALPDERARRLCRDRRRTRAAARSRRSRRATWSWSKARTPAAWGRWSKPSRRASPLPRAAADDRQGRGNRLMLYFLGQFGDQVSVLNVFRYITFRTGGRDDDGARLRLPVRADDHRGAARPPGQGPADPRRRAAEPSLTRRARRPWAA